MPKSQLIEYYSKLQDMKPGEIAVSKNRQNVYICGYHMNPVTKMNEKVILNINKLDDKYQDHWDMNEPIKILGKGNKILVDI